MTTKKKQKESPADNERRREYAEAKRLDTTAISSMIVYPCKKKIDSKDG